MGTLTLAYKYRIPYFATTSYNDANKYLGDSPRRPNATHTSLGPTRILNRLIRTISGVCEGRYRGSPGRGLPQTGLGQRPGPCVVDNVSDYYLNETSTSTYAWQCRCQVAVVLAIRVWNSVLPPLSSCYTGRHHRLRGSPCLRPDPIGVSIPVQVVYLLFRRMKRLFYLNEGAL